MRKPIHVLLLIFLSMGTVSGQVGVGVSGTIEASAKLQVDAANKGLLPPRVSLQGTDDATKSTPTIVAPSTGLLVYNIATAGSGATAVTPGFYYYDGVRWQRVINTMDATVTFNGTNPSSATSFTGGPSASSNYIYVSDTDNSQWTWNGSAYVTYNPPASTAWNSAGGTTDAGSSKSGAIYRSGKVGVGGSNNPNATLDVRTSPTSTSNPGAGFVGIGTTAASASSAGAGALAYSTSNGGTLVYSNGSQWNTLGSTVQKSLVSGYFTGTYTNTFYGDLSTTEVLDVNNDFNAGTFTVPRTGNYTFSCTISTNGAGDCVSEGTWEVQVEPSGGQAKMVSRFVVPSSATITTLTMTATGAYTASLTAGTTVTFKVYNSTGFSQTLAGMDYNRFSIVEN